MMVPKWFDKNPALTNDDNVEQLRLALRLARDAYPATRPGAAPGSISRAHYAALLDAGRRHGLEPLSTSFGPAVLDRAVLDALCRHAALSFSAAMRGNLCGIGHGLGLADVAPDLAGCDIDALLAQRPPPRIDRGAPHGRPGRCDPRQRCRAGRAARRPAGDAAKARSPLRPSLLQDQAGGDAGADLARLQHIAAVLERRGATASRSTATSSTPDAQAFAEFLDGFHRVPALARAGAAGSPSSSSRSIARMRWSATCTVWRSACPC